MYVLGLYYTLNTNVRIDSCTINTVAPAQKYAANEQREVVWRGIFCCLLLSSVLPPKRYTLQHFLGHHLYCSTKQQTVRGNLQPQGPKALMEGALRRYSVLSEGITILVQVREVVGVVCGMAAVPY